MKLCRTCKHDLPLHCFYLNGKGQGPRLDCKACYGANVEENRRLKKAAKVMNRPAQLSSLSCNRPAPIIPALGVAGRFSS